MEIPTKEPKHMSIHYQEPGLYFQLTRFTSVVNPLSSLWRQRDASSKPETQLTASPSLYSTCLALAAGKVSNQR